MRGISDNLFHFCIKLSITFELLGKLNMEAPYEILEREEIAEELPRVSAEEEQNEEGDVERRKQKDKDAAQEIWEAIDAEDVDIIKDLFITGQLGKSDSR